MIDFKFPIVCYLEPVIPVGYGVWCVKIFTVISLIQCQIVHWSNFALVSNLKIFDKFFDLESKSFNFLCV